MTSTHDISEQDLMDYLSGSLPIERYREINDRLETDAELAARLELLRGITGDEFVSEGWNKEANQIRNMVTTSCRSKQFRSLRDDIRAGRVAVFVGPTVPRLAGLADGEEVLTALATQLGRQLNTEDSEGIERLKHLGLKTLSDLFVFHFGRPRMVQLIKEALFCNRPVNELELQLHEMILQVPFSLVVSTSWDDLFEQAARRLDPPVFLNAITNDEELLSLYTPRGPMLIQPRGSLQKGSVIMEEDFSYIYQLNQPGVRGFLHNIFLTHKVLFLGFGDRDHSLLNYFHLLKTHLGEQATKLWSQSYVFAPSMSSSGADRLRQMGLRVFESSMSSTSSQIVKTTNGPLHESVALETFLRILLRETEPVVNRVERIRRIADFMQESENLGDSIRARAGLSPIGLPEKKQLEADDCSVVPPYMSIAAEHNEQERMKKGFLHAIRRAVDRGREVRLILSTDFDSIQERATNRKWVWMQLRNLRDFFSSDTGQRMHVRIVDRQGPFEMQQYILGEAELAESVKRDVHDSTYHYTRTSKDPHETKAAARLFDVCFNGLASRNLENLLFVSDDRGRIYLVDEVCHALTTGRADTILAAPETYNSEAAQLAGEIRAAARSGDGDPELVRDTVEILLTTSPAHVVLNVLADEILYQAIKQHLIAQWEQEMEMLEETRPGWMIRLETEDGKPKGDLDKDACHTSLYGRNESALYNLHMGAFALTSDAKRLILRKRRADGPPFDPGKWDRTVSGHVRKDSTFSLEFTHEVLDHFESCGICESSVVSPAEFMKCSHRRCQESSTSRQSVWNDGHAGELLAVRLHRDPIPGVYDRVRAPDSEPVKESARSMLYLCIMPHDDLPRSDPNKKHFSDWAEIPLEDVGRLLSTETPIRCTTVISGESEEIGPHTMTAEAWKLLRRCYSYIQSNLRLSGAS
ncbi:MAG: SIR2 family protein [Pirellulaceae bacterium]